jgi:hypothetical protein
VDARPAVALTGLGQAGAFQLLAPGFRFTPATAGAVAAVPDVLRWCVAHAVAVDPLELLAVALLAEQAPAVVPGAARRLALAGERLARLERVLAEDREVARRLAVSVSRVQQFQALADRSELALGWRYLRADPGDRAVLQWFVSQGRHVRTLLRGDEVIALGVPPGPRVGQVLTALREARLDGTVAADRVEEVRFVEAMTGREG